MSGQLGCETSALEETWIKSITEKGEKKKSLIIATYLERGQHLICLLIWTRGNGVAGITVRVDDSVPSLPADDDWPFSPSCTVQLLHVTLLGHGGVGVTGDHRWDWKGRRNSTWDRKRQWEQTGAGANEGSAEKWISAKRSMRKKGKEKREQSDNKWGSSGRGEWKR